MLWYSEMPRAQLFPVGHKGGCDIIDSICGKLIKEYHMELRRLNLEKTRVFLMEGVDRKKVHDILTLINRRSALVGDYLGCGHFPIMLVGKAFFQRG